MINKSNINEKEIENANKSDIDKKIQIFKKIIILLLVNKVKILIDFDLNNLKEKVEEKYIINKLLEK